MTLFRLEMPEESVLTVHSDYFVPATPGAGTLAEHTTMSISFRFFVNQTRPGFWNYLCHMIVYQVSKKQMKIKKEQ